jgi:hypothetical protein
VVDGSTTYLGWRDLVDTLEELVRRELENTGATRMWLNFPDVSTKTNQSDHSDHVSVGEAMDAVASRLPCANVNRNVGHPTMRMKENLTPEQTALQAGVYAVTESAIEEAGCGDSCNSIWGHHRRWLGRSYSRTAHGDASHCFESRCVSCPGNRTCVDDMCVCANPQSCPRGQRWDNLACACAN